MADKQKFDNRAAFWRVVVDGEDFVVEHDGYVKTVQPKECLSEIADMMADMVKRTIVAMPENRAKELHLNCSWQ